MTRFLAWLIEMVREWGTFGRKGAGDDGLSFPEQQTSPDATSAASTPFLDAHHLDKDQLWLMYHQRREAERQARMQAMLNDLFAPIEPWRHSGQPSNVSSKSAWSMQDQVLWHEAYAAFLLGPVDHPYEGETDGAD